MEEWPIDLCITSSPPEEHIKPETQPLQAVSGNRQTPVLDCYAGVENQRPPHVFHNPSSFPDDKGTVGLALGNVTPGSNGQAPSNRLQHRRRRRQRQQCKDRSYLYCEKYLAYKDRPRKDLGPDKKQVWSDRVEEAFQEALWVVDPRGMEKRPQNGKQYGQNQLIAEYIYQKTGESRDRKQVMSHLQVLKKMLEDEPSWRALMKRGKKSGYAQSANRAYYEHCIVDKVHQQQYLSSQQASTYPEEGGRVLSEHLPPPSQTLGSNGFAGCARSLKGVNFEMWMSPNKDQTEERLHNFTSLQDDRGLPGCDPSLLEKVRNWQSLYPCLAEMIDWKHQPATFDIIMVDTSFKVMSDFPPPKASLGLRLELNFGPQSGGESVHWTCTTHVYRNGILVKEPSYYRLESRRGMIAPPFETKWWAKTFIEQVEQRKQAQEKSQGAVYDATQERSYGFFSQLTAVHQIWAGSGGDAAGMQGARRERKLVAVLLWKFSMAPERYVGTTSWQRLVPPSPRMTANSATPTQQGMIVSPFAMDGVADGLQHALESSRDQGLFTDTELQVPYDDGHHAHDLAPQTGLEFSFGGDGMDHVSAMPSSMIPFSQAEHGSGDFSAFDDFNFDFQLQGLANDSHQNLYPLSSGHPFQPYDEEADRLSRGDVPAKMYGVPVEFDHEMEDSATRHPLANFDHHTHDMLQVQLGEPTSGSNGQAAATTTEDDTLNAALAAASAMNELSHTPTMTSGHHPPSLGIAPEHDDGMLASHWKSVPFLQQQQQRGSFLHDTRESFNNHAIPGECRSNPRPNEQVVHGSEVSQYDDTMATTDSSMVFHVNSDAFDVNHLTGPAAATSSSSQLQLVLKTHDEEQALQSPVEKTSHPGPLSDLGDEQAQHARAGSHTGATST